MPIRNDAELAVAVSKASQLLQDIHDYCGLGRRADAKVKFPRRLIRTAEYFRSIFPGYMNYRQSSSCAYGLMYLDVIWWMAARTDISGIAKEMIIKSAIITLGTILEAVLHIPNEGIFDSAAGVRPRVQRAFERGWINEFESDTLKQLWENRNNVHLRLLGSHEFGKYDVADVNGPRRALEQLMKKLSHWHTARA